MKKIDYFVEDLGVGAEPTLEQLVEGMVDIEDWSLMICVSCGQPFDLMNAITNDGCRCPHCGKFHGDFI